MQQQKGNSGRIDVLNGPQYKAYDRVANDKNCGGSEHYSKEALRGIFDTSQSQVGRLFFDQMNINALQIGLKRVVLQRSCGKYAIGNQSEDDLKVIMRSIFLQHSKNQPFNIVEQVRELNGLILEFCADRIINEINMNENYKRDISQPLQLIDRAQNTSTAGNKTLELKKFI